VDSSFPQALVKIETRVGVNVPAGKYRDLRVVRAAEFHPIFSAANRRRIASAISWSFTGFVM
jgi:hypothetical protein